MANILVFAETRGNALRKVALEAVTAARALADATSGGEVHALVAGTPGVGAVAAELGKYGADVVVTVEHAGYANFDRESVASTIAARAKAGSYRAVVLGFSAQGRDLGPRLAAKLDAPIVSDVTEIQATGSTLTVKHPGYANKVIATLERKLQPGGYLLLGHSESLAGLSAGFELVHLPGDMVYRRPASHGAGDGA